MKAPNHTSRIDWCADCGCEDEPGFFPSRTGEASFLVLFCTMGTRTDHITAGRFTVWILSFFVGVTVSLPSIRWID